MENVKINMDELATVVVDELALSLDIDGELIYNTDTFSDLCYDLFINYTPDKMVPLPGALKQFGEDLILYIKKELYRRIILCYNYIEDADHKEILSKFIHVYEVISE